MEGLSVRTIFINVFFQLVIMLYLFDNDTSWMILLSNVVGFGIEVWKLRKAVKFEVGTCAVLLSVAAPARAYLRV